MAALQVAPVTGVRGVIKAISELPLSLGKLEIASIRHVSSPYRNVLSQRMLQEHCKVTG